jgi:hypothetical protein
MLEAGHAGNIQERDCPVAICVSHGIVTGWGADR